MKTLKQRLRAGEVVFGATVSEYLRPSVVKAFVNAGFDFIYIENEHATISPPALADFVLCCLDNDMTVVAKLEQLERGDAAKLMEMGVKGLQLPRTESAEDMVTLHDYIKYPPTGSRASATGYGNSRYAKVADKQAWYQASDEEMLLLAHIETQAGVEQVESIVAVEGVDIAFIGTSDLSLCYGQPGEYKTPAMLERMQLIFNTAAKNNVICGMPATDYEMTKYWIDRGVQFFECVSDLDLLRSGAAKAVEQLHRARGD